MYFKNSYKIIWDKSKPTGDKIRILDTKILKKMGFNQSTNLKEGVYETIDWYKKNKEKQRRFNIFKNE